MNASPQSRNDEATQRGHPEPRKYALALAQGTPRPCDSTGNTPLARSTENAPQYVQFRQILAGGVRGVPVGVALSLAI